jgi:alanine racemase
MLSWIDVDGGALRHNFRAFRQLVGEERAVPVLKSNAYGHGLAAAHEALLPEAPAWVAVNYVSEAETLRRLGFDGRILVVGPSVARELPAATAARAEPVIGNWEVLHAWAAAGAPVLAHIKFDTGMSRQGFRPEDAGEVVRIVRPHAARVAGVCTHFANVEDVTDHSYADRQLERFEAAVGVLRSNGLTCLRHAASSASSLLLDAARFDLCRIGISLYGVWPSPVTRVSYRQLHQDLVDLKPVLSWRTEVTTVKPVRAGDYIGYGCTYRAIRDMRVAVLPVGYYEGYPRIAGEHASYVLIRGCRCPIVGRICMNMMMVDATHVDGVSVGDVATLIGTDGTETLSAHEVAVWAQTIHYELLARLSPELPRRLL